MTITINTSANVTTAGYGSSGNPYSPFPFSPGLYGTVGVGIGITDTATDTVTLSVTQNSVLHSLPGSPTDQVTPIQAGTFSLSIRDYTYSSPPSNPPTVTANSFTNTGPLNPSMQSVYDPTTSSYAPMPYSPTAALLALRNTQPIIALTGNQLIETDLTITATDTMGGSASKVVKYLFTNPISMSNSLQYAFPNALHSSASSAQILYLTAMNANDHGYGTSSGTTITVTQSNVIHTVPSGASGDQPINVAPGTLTFTPRGGDATNAPTFNPITGTLVATGSLTSPMFGTTDPVDYPSGYTPHTYSPSDIVNNLYYSPGSSVKLNGSQYLETTFIITSTDRLTGSSQNVTVVKDFTNPVHISSLSGSINPVYGSSILPFSGINTNVSNVGTGTISASISQVSFIHTNPGAADDQRFAVGSGMFSSNNPTSASLITTAAGLLIAGNLSDVSSVLSNLKFTPASVSLTGKQTLETDFTIVVTDSFGDTDTTTRVLTEVQPTPITVVGVGITQSSGTLMAGQTVAIKVGVSAPITVAGGVPTLTLNDGGTAIYDAGSSTSQLLSFNYTVGTGDATARLAISSIDTNGSTIGGLYGAALNLTNGVLFTPFGSGSLSVVGRPPVVTSPIVPVTTAPNTPVPTVSAPSVFRFFDSINGTHFFTSSPDERTSLLATRPDLVLETNGFGAVDASAPGAVSVFRFFDMVHGTQFITSNTSERDTVLASRPDLTFEASNIFYEHGNKQTGDTAVYRFFDSKLGTHFYTGNQAEHDTIGTPGGAGYRADLVSEGVAFYAPTGLFK